MTRVLTSTIEVYAGLVRQATSEIKVGVPIQGDIRNLATDQWSQAYPG